MSAIFDTLEYAKAAEKIGMKREQAEFQAHELSKLVDNQLITKSSLKDELKTLKDELKKLEVTIIKWMIGISFAQMSLMLGIVGFILKH